MTWVYVLVGADAGGFESLGAQLLILVGDEVDAAWEFVHVGALAAEIENSVMVLGGVLAVLRAMLVT